MSGNSKRVALSTLVMVSLLPVMMANNCNEYDLRYIGTPDDAVVFRNRECAPISCEFTATYDMQDLRACYNVYGGQWVSGPNGMPPEPLASECDPNQTTGDCTITWVDTTFNGACAMDEDAPAQCTCSEGERGDCFNNPDCCLSPVEAENEIRFGDYCNDDNENWALPSDLVAQEMKDDCPLIYPATWYGNYDVTCDTLGPQFELGTFRQGGCLTTPNPSCDPNSSLYRESSSAASHQMPATPSLSFIEIDILGTQTRSEVWAMASSSASQIESFVAVVGPIDVGGTNYGGWTLGLMNPQALTPAGPNTFTIAPPSGFELKGAGVVDGVTNEGDVEVNNPVTLVRDPSGWSLDYASSWAGGTVTVHLEGPVFPTSAP